MLIYSIGSLFIAGFNIAPEAYSLYTYDNALYIFIISLSIFTAIYYFDFVTIACNIRLNKSRINIAFGITLFVTIPLCYFFPWGVFGQELGVGHSVKALFRHVYTVASFFFLLVNHRRLFFLILVDVVMLFLDPSRFFFIEAVVPKIVFVMSLFRNVNGFRMLLYISLVVFLLLLFQSFRLGSVSLDFVAFALYSDIVHASYPAMQLAQFSKEHPLAPIMSSVEFFDIYNESIAPLGGFFLPGFFAISGSIFIDVLVAFSVTLIALKFLSVISKNSLIFPVISGVVLLFQKFPPLTIFKLVLVLYLIVSIFRYLKLFSVRASV
jgi:hypothetical protein